MTAVSFFAQRGLLSVPVVFVIHFRAPLASIIAMSPRSAKSTRFRALSHRPLAGGTFFFSSSVSFAGVPPARPTT